MFQMQEFNALGKAVPHLRSSAPLRSEFSDDPDFMELIEFFVEAMAERIDTFQILLQEQNLEQLRTFAHQLKGAGGGYGFPMLTEVAAEMEHACLRESRTSVTQIAPRLLDVMKRISV